MKILNLILITIILFISIQCSNSEETSKNASNISINTLFFYRDERAKENEYIEGVSRKFLAGDSVYMDIQIEAINLAANSINPINCRVVIPIIKNLNIDFIGGRLLNLSTNDNYIIYKLPVEIYFKDEKKFNTFSFRIQTKDAITVPIKLEFENPYNINNTQSSIEFKKKSIINNIGDFIGDKIF